VKASKRVDGAGSMRNALLWAERCLGVILAGGGNGELIIKSSDGPTDDMRKKLHAMIGDIADCESGRYFRGADMGATKRARFDSWKAVLVSAAVADRFVPGYNGGLISVRPSSENLRKKEYCDAIEAAYQIGAELKVTWSDDKCQPTT